MLVDELKKVNDAIIAPSKPFVRNFEQETEEEKVNQPNRPAAGSKGNVHGFSLKQWTGEMTKEEKEARMKNPYPKEEKKETTCTI